VTEYRSLSGSVPLVGEMSVIGFKNSLQAWPEPAPLRIFRRSAMSSERAAAPIWYDLVGYAAESGYIDTLVLLTVRSATTELATTDNRPVSQGNSIGPHAIAR
jgi:hypothetical protein